MEVALNAFYEGVNRDVSKHITQNTTMYDNKNFRLITQDGQSYAALENVKGNDEFLDVNGTQLQIDTGWEIIGNCVVRDDIVLFGVRRTMTPYPSARIYLYKFNYVTKKYVQRIVLFHDAHNVLNFDQPITTIGRYENEYDIKVYWTDNDNNMRYMNIAPDIDPATNLPKTGLVQTDYTRIQNQDIEDFELLQNIKLSQPTFNGYMNGTLMSGMVQYAYRLYNRYGGESMFSPTTALIPIFDKQGNSKVNSYGLEPNKQSNLGVKGIITLTGDSLLLDRIEIVSLHYSYYNAVPTINIVDIQPVSSTIYFQDTGVYSLGQISLSEFTQVKNDFTCKTLETKDDRLFVGNIKETYFDVENYDARAYRFMTTKRVRAFEANLNYDIATEQYFYIRDDGTWNEMNGSGRSGYDWNLPEDANLINPYNILTEDSSPSNFPHIYQKNGTTLGGSGKNVSYTFGINQSVIDSDITQFSIETDIDNSNYTLGIAKGFQRDEIYRFGVVFFDNKGRQSFVKWIGDIRMPNAQEIIPPTLVIGNKLYRNVIYPIFNVTLPSGASSYQIVYVKREDSDKTVIANCLINGVYKNFTTPDLYSSEYPLAANPPHGLTRKYFELTSPDIDIFDVDINNCKLYIEGRSYHGGRAVYKSHIFTKFMSNTYGIALNAGGDTRLMLNVLDFLKIDGADKFSIDSAIYNFDGIVYTSVVKGVPAGVEPKDNPFRNKCYLVKLAPQTLASIEPLIGYLRRQIIGYGGNTFTDRTSNIYIPCSNLNSGQCWYGDTVIDYHESLISINHMSLIDDFGLSGLVTYIVDSGNPTTLWGFPPDVAFIPTESTIVQALRHDTQIYKVMDNDKSLSISNYGNNEFQQQSITKNIFNNFKEVVNEGTITTGWTDLYLYNKVYSQPNSTKTFVPKPLDWQKQVTFDTRIRYSNLKFNGEERDSWLQFMANNFNEVDSSYGSLNQLINFRNEILCFQESGFCVAPVNQQVIEESDTGINTVLGFGEVLPKQFNYNYGSTEVGIQGNNKLIKSLTALYWIDVNKRKMYRYSGTVDSFSDIKGLKGYLNNLVKNTTTFTGIYDNEYAEVLITFEGTTLVFSELIDAFQGWYTITPDFYIKTPRDVLSTDNKNLLWKHNVGQRANWYNTIYDSAVSVIVNSGTNSTKEFNNIEYMSEVYDPDNDYRDVPNETLSTLKAENDIMSSQVINLKPYVPGDTLYTGGLEVTLPAGVANIRRRMRMWRTVVPRVLRTNQYMDNARFRDAYVKLTFTYNNYSNYKLVLHPINTYYSSSHM